MATDTKDPTTTATTKLPAISKMASRTQSKICRRSSKEFNTKRKPSSSERLTKSNRTDRKTVDDVELGKAKLPSRYYHQPIHHRLFNYLKKLFESSTTQYGKKFFLYLPFYITNIFDASVYCISTSIFYMYMCIYTQ